MTYSEFLYLLDCQWTINIQFTDEKNSLFLPIMHFSLLFQHCLRMVLSSEITSQNLPAPCSADESFTGLTKHCICACVRVSMRTFHHPQTPWTVRWTPASFQMQQSHLQHGAEWSWQAGMKKCLLMTLSPHEPPLSQLDTKQGHDLGFWSKSQTFK